MHRAMGGQMQQGVHAIGQQRCRSAEAPMARESEGARSQPSSGTGEHVCVGHWGASVQCAGEQRSRGAGEQGSRGAGAQGRRGAGAQGSRGAGEQATSRGQGSMCMCVREQVQARTEAQGAGEQMQGYAGGKGGAEDRVNHSPASPLGTSPALLAQLRAHSRQFPLELRNAPSVSDRQSMLVSQCSGVSEWTRDPSSGPELRAGNSAERTVGLSSRAARADKLAGYTQLNQSNQVKLSRVESRQVKFSRV